MWFQQRTQTHTFTMVMVQSHLSKRRFLDARRRRWFSPAKKLSLSLALKESKASLTRWCVPWEQVKTFQTIWQSFTNVSGTRFGVSAETECRASSLKCVKSVLLQPKPLPWCPFFWNSSRSLKENLGSCLSAKEMVDLMWCSAAALQLNLRRGTNMQLQASILGATFKVQVLTQNASIVCFFQSLSLFVIHQFPLRNNENAFEVIAQLQKLLKVFERVPPSDSDTVIHKEKVWARILQKKKKKEENHTTD